MVKLCQGRAFFLCPTVVEVQIAAPLPAVNPDVFNAHGDERQRQQGDETPQSEAKEFAEF